MRQAARVIVIKDDCLLMMKRNKFGQQFYALVGGGVDIGETTVEALYREVTEETGLTIENDRLVIIEDAGPMFGLQYIYVCDYVSGEPALDPESMEAKITADGQNTYQPIWVPLDEIGQVNLLPVELKDRLVDMLKTGWPSEPISLTVRF
jgi:8-oxo-dGTP diphosphatase